MGHGTTAGVRLACLAWVLTLAAPGRAAEVPDYLRPVAAEARQLSETVVQLEMTLAGPPPFNADPGRVIHYVWRLDTDSNPATGQRHGEVGSEYNARVTLQNRSLSYYGYVDGIDGRPSVFGLGAVVDGDRVLIRIPLVTVGRPSRFTWTCAAQATGDAGASLGRRMTFELNPPEFVADRPVRVVIDPSLALRDGTTSAPLPVRAYDGHGQRLDLAGREIKRYCYSDRLHTTDTGVAAEPGVVGCPRVTASVDGVVSCNAAAVKVGCIAVVPALLHLNPGTPTGKIDLLVTDAGGTVLPADGHAARFDISPRDGVATITQRGEVRITTEEANKRAAVTATFYGMRAENACYLWVVDRSAPAGPGIEARGRNNSHWYVPHPPRAGESKDWFERKMARYGYVEVTDAAYDAAAEVTGAMPFWSGRQHWALQNAPGGGAGGHAGNPVHMGFDWRSWNGPPWGVAAHEMGHNFTLGFGLLCRLTQGDRGLSSHVQLMESHAHWYMFYTLYEVLRRPGHHGLVGEALENVRQAYVGCVRGEDLRFQGWLETGEQFPGSFNYSPFLMTLGRQFGPSFTPRLLSIFWPPDEIIEMEFESDTELKRSTFMVAAFSAAARCDLRRQLREWHFAVDDRVFEELLPVLTERAGQRDAEFPADPPVADDVELPSHLSWVSDPDGLSLAIDGERVLGPITVGGAKPIGPNGCPYVFEYRAGERTVTLAAIIDPLGIRLELTGDDLTGLRIAAPAVLGASPRLCRTEAGRRADVAMLQYGDGAPGASGPSLYDASRDRALQVSSASFTGLRGGGYWLFARPEPEAKRLSVPVTIESGLTARLLQGGPGSIPPYQGHPGLPNEVAALAAQVFAPGDVATLDLFPYPRTPRVFDWKVGTTAGAWDVVAFVNTERRPKLLQVDMPGLDLKPSGDEAAYVAYDLDRQCIAGPLGDDDLGCLVPAGSCRVFVVVKRLDTPTVLSPYGLNEQGWDPATGVLSGRSTPQPGAPLVAIACPPGLELASAQTDRGQAACTYSPGGAVITVIGARDEEVRWQARFTKRRADEPPTTGPRLTGTMRGETTVSLSWRPSEDAAGYRVTRNGRTCQVGVETDWTDTTVIPGRPFRYQVTALDTAGRASPPSNPLDVPGGPVRNILLSQLAPDDTHQSWGDLKRDRSVEGRPLSIGGRRFEHGWGTHAYSSIRYDLGRFYDRFQAWVGIDEECHSNGSVVFRVLLDGEVAYDSGTLRGGDPARRVDISVAGRNDMILVAHPGGDGNNSDHADWAEPMLLAAGATELAAPAGRTAVANPEGESAQLIDFSATGVESRVQVNEGQTGVTYQVVGGPAGKALEVTCQPNQTSYPGVLLLPDGPSWDLSAFKYVEARVVNTGPGRLYVALRVDNAGPWQTHPWNIEGGELQPGESVTGRVYFGRSWGKPDFALDPSKVTRIGLTTGKSDQVQTFRIESVVAGRE